MGQNFDDYSGFQQTPGMPILLQHSVRRHKLQQYTQHEEQKFSV